MGNSSRNSRSRASRQRKSSSSVRLGVLISILVLIVVAAGALMAPGLNITEVYCEGNSKVKVEDIITAAQIENGKNILLANVGRAKREVEKLAMIKDATVRRVFPNKICISVEERIPFAYIKTGAGVAAIDSDRIVLRVEQGETAEKIVSDNTPKFDNTEEENGENKDEYDYESGEDYVDDENTSEEDKPSENESAEEETPVESKENILAVPYVSGFELKSADEGETAKCEDEDRFNKAVEICDALNKAGLLERTTYINLDNMQSVKIVVENRIEVQLENADNIEYRARFLAEVINNKISAYEEVIMDYTGDDIYVRARDDGKDRVVPKEDEDTDETSENDQDTEADEEENSEDEKIDESEDADIEE